MKSGLTNVKEIYGNNTRIRLVVLQATPFCNINCSYCYLPAASRASKRRMSLKTIENTFSRIFESGWVDSQFTVSWHAGEPMVLPIEYYESAFALASKAKNAEVKIVHSFQTNGTLITDEWCEFFKRHDVRVGLSIDGPKEIHDTHRIARSGKGTFDIVMDGVDKLKKHGITFSAIAVITKESVTQADLLYKFFEDLGVSGLSLNPEEMDGAHLESSLHTEMIQLAYGQLLKHFWSLASSSGTLNRIREIERMLSCVVRPDKTEIFNEQVHPFSLLNVDYEGNFSTFSPEFLGMHHDKYGDFCFGNINEVPLASGFKHPNFVRLYKDILEGVTMCKASCNYFSVCGGGAPANKLIENGVLSSTETMFCKLSTKLNCDFALKFIEQGAVQPINKSEWI